MVTTNLYNCATLVKNLINDNWSLSKKPQVDFLWEEKTVGFLDDREDSIILTSTGENIDYFGLFGQDLYHTVFISLEAWTYQNLEYHENFISELIRIFKSNIKSTDYVILTITGSDHENDLYRNIYKHRITLSIKQLNP